MDNWLFYDTDVTEMPKGIVAFVYKIEIAGKYYIGKKNVYTNKKCRLTKKEKLENPRKRFKTVTKESNWRGYCSSSDDIKQLVKEGETPVRYILRYCTSLKEASYFEEKYLHNAIADVSCLNKNIGGRYFKEEIRRWI